MIDAPLDIAMEIIRDVAGKDALYTPKTGDPYNVRVLLSDPDAMQGQERARVRQRRAVIEVRAADVAADPVRGDMITIDGVTHTVREVPVLDADRIWWRLACSP